MIAGTKKATSLTLASLTLLGSLLMTTALAGPPKSPKKPPKSGTSKPTKAQIEAGKKVYDAQGCAGCHKIDGKGGSSGPDLSKVGADPKHTLKWLEDQVKDPKSHDADSKMPAYGDKIKGKDLTNLAAYLSSLKGASKSNK